MCCYGIVSLGNVFPVSFKELSESNSGAILVCSVIKDTAYILLFGCGIDILMMCLITVIPSDDAGYLHHCNPVSTQT